MNATAWVGVAALVAATAFNVLALRRSGETLRLAEQAYAAGEKRYRQDRADARGDALRDALIDVAASVAAYNVASARYESLADAARRGLVEGVEVAAHDADRVRPAAAEVYRAAKLAHFLLEDEPALRKILFQLEKAVIAAAQLTTDTDLSAQSYRRITEECAVHRSTAGSKASELLDVGRDAVERRRTLGPR